MLVEECARLGEQLGIERQLATAHVFRVLLHSPSSAAGFHGLLEALLFHGQLPARARELVILRMGWRAGSEYVFCNHARYSRELGISDEDILGVRDPERCGTYGEADRAVLRLADELHDCAAANEQELRTGMRKKSSAIRPTGARRIGRAPQPAATAPSVS